MKMEGEDGKGSAHLLSSDLRHRWSTGGPNHKAVLYVEKIQGRIRMGGTTE